MACHHLRKSAQCNSFHARLPDQTAAQSNPLAMQGLNIAKRSLLSAAQI
jgi:hypothetical protein